MKPWLIVLMTVPLIAACKELKSEYFEVFRSGTPETVSGVLKAGYSLEDRDKNGTTPLMWAAGFNRDPAVIELLIKAGASVKERSIRGFTPLMYAAWKSRNPEIVEILLKAGAEIEERDTNGSTALMHAAENRVPGIFASLIASGAEIDARNDDGWTALIVAAALNDNLALIAAILDAGADGSIKDKNGKTAFDYVHGNPSLKGTEAYGLLKKAAGL